MKKNINNNGFSLCTGPGVVNYLASGTLISISTAKGNTILQKEGDKTSIIKTTLNIPVVPNTDSSSGRRWNHYETALSNTGPLGAQNGETSPSSLNTSTTSKPTTEETISSSVEPSPTLSSVEIDIDEDSGNTTRKPNSGGRSSNKTSSSGKNSKDLLNNARKYIASYEDLQSRFPDGSPFENNTSINMTVPLGDTAFLRCRVRNLGERSVSFLDNKSQSKREMVSFSSFLPH